MYFWIFWIPFTFLLLRVVIPFFVILFRYTLGRKWFSKRKQLREAGEWAIITGATDGIGKAYAQELASDGLNVMLISRTQEKLDRVAEELRNAYKVQVNCMQADFTQLDIYERIKEEVDRLPSIACLVNNVGMMNMDPASFPFSDDMSIDQIHRFIACNCISTACMTRIVLPRLIQQNSGAALINLSSYAGCSALPYLTLYGATKAFMRQLSASLALEVQNRNVLIQTLCPLYVSTALIGRRRGLLIIDPDELARHALNHLGVEEQCEGHLLHALEAFCYGLLHPSLISDSMEKSYQRTLRDKEKTS